MVFIGSLLVLALAVPTHSQWTRWLAEHHGPIPKIGLFELLLVVGTLVVLSFWWAKHSRPRWIIGVAILLSPVLVRTWRDFKGKM